MKKIAVLLTLVFAFLVVASPALAKPTNENTQGIAGQSDMVHMNLVPTEDAPEGAWGRVTHNYSGDSLGIVLNAVNLEPNTDYVVKSKGNVIAEGTTNAAGNLHITATWDQCMDLMDGRINVRNKDTDVRVLWTDVYNVFDCTE